jgi:hypothetical protein
MYDPTTELFLLEFPKCIFYFSLSCFYFLLSFYIVILAVISVLCVIVSLSYSLLIVLHFHVGHPSL